MPADGPTPAATMVSRSVGHSSRSCKVGGSQTIDASSRVDGTTTSSISLQRADSASALSDSIC
jgi:hypothetical protein